MCLSLFVGALTIYKYDGSKWNFVQHLAISGVNSSMKGYDVSMHERTLVCGVQLTAVNSGDIYNITCYILVNYLTKY